MGAQRWGQAGAAVWYGPMTGVPSAAAVCKGPVLDATTQSAWAWRAMSWVKFSAPNKA